MKQRARALNAFLYDVYHRAEIVRAGRHPGRAGLSATRPTSRRWSASTRRAGSTRHIVGIDLVRTGPDDFFVLEDNCRTPSGVSYMLENREIMMRMFPELFRANRIAPVDDYPDRLRRTLASVAPPKCEGEPVSRDPDARARSTAPITSTPSSPTRWGSNWSRGRTCSSQGDFVYMRTTEGPKRVDVIYRRIDDAYPRPAVLPARLDAGRARADERLPLGRA